MKNKKFTAILLSLITFSLPIQGMDSFYSLVNSTIKFMQNHPIISGVAGITSVTAAYLLYKNYYEGKSQITYQEQIHLNQMILKATQENKLDDVKTFLNRGTNVNAKDEAGNTALHCATWRNNLDMVKLLIQHGADVNAQGEDGETALHWAVGHDNLDIATLLIQHGADVNAKDNKGRTALYCAAYNNNTDIATLLIQHGADVNAKDKNGQVALYCAAKYSNLDMVKLLIQHGADVNAKDKNGQVALDIARIYHPGSLTETYLQLITEDYKAAQQQNRVAEFLQPLTDEQKDDILAIAIAQGHEIDLVTFNNLNPKRYSWFYMLGFAEQLNVSDTVPFTLQKLSISTNEMEYILKNLLYVSDDTKKKLDPIKDIFNTAKDNNHKKFGNAMLNYYTDMRKMKLTGIKTAGKDYLGNDLYLPQEVVSHILQFHQFASTLEKRTNK
jgi:ankyrin repeat protein